MKKLFVIIFLVVLMQNNRVRAQITLEHTLDSTSVPYFYCTDIGNNDFKYVFLNAVTNSFSLYNMDMSPFLIDIHIPVTTDSIVQGFGVIYISKDLFDCDTTNVEYVYQNSYDTNHTFRIFRTDGTLLLKVDSANGPWALGGIYGGSYFFRPIINTSAGAKLFLQKYDNNHIPEILIYALCGKLSASVFDFGDHIPSVNIFPNPSAMQLNFEIALPNNQEEFQLMIFDSNAKEQQQEKVILIHNKYTLDVSKLNNGLYYYSLVSKNRVYQTGKFIITK